MAEVVTKLERLREIALDQHGFVTTSQALDDGVSAAELSMMTRRGRIERVAHGVYRVPQVLDTQYDQYQLALLWTGVANACLSHETALQAWELCDVNPDRIHITVPKTARLRRSGGEQYVVHHQTLPASSITWWEGMPIADVATAISLSTTGGTPTYLLKQALSAATKTGQLTQAERRSLTLQIRNRDLHT